MALKDVYLLYKAIYPIDDISLTSFSLLMFQNCHDAICAVVSVPHMDIVERLVIFALSVTNVYQRASYVKNKHIHSTILVEKAFNIQIFSKRGFQPL